MLKKLQTSSTQGNALWLNAYADVLDVRFGRLVWLIGTNLEHLYRFRYSLMIRRLKLMFPLQLLRGVCAVWEWSDEAVVAACAGWAVTPLVVAAELEQRGAECAQVAALVAAVVRFV